MPPDRGIPVWLGSVKLSLQFGVPYKLGSVRGVPKALRSCEESPYSLGSVCVCGGPYSFGVL